MPNKKRRVAPGILDLSGHVSVPHRIDKSKEGEVSLEDLEPDSGVFAMPGPGSQRSNSHSRNRAGARKKPRSRPGKKPDRAR